MEKLSFFVSNLIIVEFIIITIIYFHSFLIKNTFFTKTEEIRRFIEGNFLKALYLFLWITIIFKILVIMVPLKW